MFKEFDVAVCQHVKVAMRPRIVAVGRSGIFRTGNVNGIGGIEGNNAIVVFVQPPVFCRNDRRRETIGPMEFSGFPRRWAISR